jgi:multiple sugar transport system substrate-binding protein
MKSCKIVLIFLLLTLFSLTLFPAKMTITWWINPWRIAPPGFPADKAPSSEDYPKWISEEFMKLHPDVEVKYVVVGNQEYAQKMAASIATKTQPDLFKGPVWDSRWAKNGLLEPIDSYLTEEDRKDIYEKVLDEGLIDGKRYIWPWNFGTNGMGTTMLLYTPDFEKAEVDWREIVNNGWTMEEFVDICKKLTWDANDDGEIDHYAISFGAKDIHNVINFLYAFGGKLSDPEETVVTLNTPEAAAGLQFLVDLVNVHKVAPKGVEALGVYDVIGNFHSHRTSIGFGGPYEIGRITRYILAGTLKEQFYPVVAPFPHVEGKDPVALSSGSGFVIFKQADKAKRDMVFEFVRFLTNQENLALLETLQYLTARVSVNENLYLNDPYMNKQVKTYGNIMGLYGMPFFGSQEFPWSQMSNFFISAIEGAFAGSKTPQKALDDFVTEANKILKKAK